MAAKEKQHALYMMKKDGLNYARAVLVHADDVEDRRKEGYVEPIGQKANGTQWNAEEDQAQQDAAAELAKVGERADSEKAAKKAAEFEASRKEAEKNAAPAHDRPDFKVEIVEPPKPDKSKK